MSDEDRSQAPSQHRRQQARAQGLVARSGELTAAAGLLAGVVLLGVWGEALAAGLDTVLRASWAGDLGPVGVPEVAARLRQAALAVLMPLATIVGGIVLAMLATHTLQTAGFWAPTLLAPDVSRFARAWQGGSDLPARLGRSSWTLVRALVLIVVATLAVRQALPALARLDRLEGGHLVAASAALVRQFAFTAGLTLLVLGAIDYALQWRRLEAALRVSPEQFREELKSLDGDPAVRARRLRVARGRLNDPQQALKGAAVVLTGPGGLTVVLAGSPPPGAVQVRQVSRGAAATAIVRAAQKQKLRRLEAPELARWFAGARYAGGRAPVPALPPELAAELARRWPRPEPSPPRASEPAPA